MKNKVFILLALGFTTGSLLKAQTPTAKLPEPSKKENVTFAADIKPIFESACIKCHGEEAQKSGLRLDSLEAVLKGGKKGPNVIVGKSAESSLVLAVARVDARKAMPPKKNFLSEEQVALIRAWIDQGAK